MLKLNDATLAHISQIKVLKITEILAHEKNHVEIDKCMLEMKDDKLLNCAFVINIGNNASTLIFLCE